MNFYIVTIGDSDLLGVYPDEESAILGIQEEVEHGTSYMDEMKVYVGKSMNIVHKIEFKESEDV